MPEKLRTWWSAFRQRREGRRLEVQCDDAGVVLSLVPPTEEPPLHLRWDEITAVYAYKRDGFSVDQIRLVLGDNSREKWIEISEDDIGGKQLLDELPRRLPGFPALSEWWDQVAQPPFATNWTRIYERTGS